MNRSREMWGRGMAGVAAGLLLGTLGCGGDGQMDRPTPLAGEPEIEYPLALWDEGVEGSCMLRVRVTEMGLVDSVEIVEASGYPAFDSAAVRGAMAMRFRPARLNGERIEVWAQVPVHFSRNGGP